MSTISHQSRNAVRHRTSMDAVNPGHPEAIALRRIIIGRGTWLSPMLAELPMPTLTEWEATCDLVKALAVWRSHTIKPEPSGPPANSPGRGRSYETPTLAEVREKRNQRPSRAKKPPVAVKAVATPEPMPTPAPPAPPVSKASKKPLGKDAKAEAIARIAAVKAKKDAEEAEKMAAITSVAKVKKAKRKEDVTAARLKWEEKHKIRMATDPDYAAACKAKRAKREKRRQERDKIKRREARIARGIPPMRTKAEREAGEKARLAKYWQDHRARMAADPDYAEAYRAKQRDKKREAYHLNKLRTEAARAALASSPPLPTAKELVAEARAAMGKK